MKLSLKWLSDYIDISEFFEKPQALDALLTAAGLEVEGIENRAKTFENVVIGNILEKGQVPNSDRLSLCQVTTGAGKVHQIVCGAQNHKAGDNVVVALPGAILPGNFEIKHSKIRGVESGGMLCSTKELGLTGESDGIMILPNDAPIGKPFSEFMGLNDIVFEIKVTPNRSDCLSHFGLAREIGAILNREAKLPLETLVETENSTKKMIELSVPASDLCPRYAGRGVRGVKVGPSPAWLKQRLEVVGLNSINNIVDVTNYVMMELGQPLHAFDVRELKGAKIVVERAQEGEKFVSLDGTEFTLKSDELTIRDGTRAVALAGVVGGQNSGVRDITTDVFIEAAYFAPIAVRRTARRLGIDTDSAYRFARGVNPEAVPLAMNRAAQLIQKVAGGEICGEPWDIYPNPVKRQPIEVTLATISGRLGYPVKSEHFIEWMNRLGCEIASSGTDSWKVTPPSFRWDLSMDMDLVEEYGRLNGYQHIPETLPMAGAAPAEHAPQYLFEKRMRGLWAGQGYLQAINYAFISSKFQERVLGSTEKLAAYGLRAVGQPVTLINPLNEELNVMRTSLIPGLLRTVAHNFRHGNALGRLFEIGFAHDGKRGGGAAEGNSYLQEGRLTLAAWGQATGLWNKENDRRAPLVFEVKSAVENVLRALQVQRWSWSQPSEIVQVPDFLHPRQAAQLTVEGKPVGFVGTVHPSLQDELKIRETVVVAEFNLERLMQGQPRAPKSKPISGFPAVDRDIALLMPKELAAGEVEAVIRKTGGDMLRDVRVFDVFEGGTLGPGQKSVAFRLIFQDLTGTLEDSWVNTVRDQVVAAVSEKFQVSVR